MMLACYVAPPSENLVTKSKTKVKKKKLLDEQTDNLTDILTLIFC